MSEPAKDAARAFGDALVREIKAEMGRQEIGGVRALATKMGLRSHGALNDRLNKSSRTGQRVSIGAEDLWRIAVALGVEPVELIRRASAAVPPADPLTELEHARRRRRK